MKTYTSPKRQANQTKIMEYLNNLPFRQMSMKKLCSDTGITYTQASSNLCKLERDGVVTKYRHGKMMIYCVTKNNLC